MEIDYCQKTASSQGTPHVSRINFSDDAYIAYDSDTDTLEIHCPGTIVIDGGQALKLQPLHRVPRRPFD